MGEIPFAATSLTSVATSLTERSQDLHILLLRTKLRIKLLSCTNLLASNRKLKVRFLNNHVRNMLDEVSEHNINNSAHL